MRSTVNPRQPVGRAASAADASLLRTSSGLGKRVARLVVFSTSAVVLVLVLGDIVDAVVFEGEKQALNADAEGNAYTWASSVAVFTCALASAVLAVAVPRHRRRFAALLAILAFFSLDDVAQIHERLNQFGSSWTIYAMPLLALTLLLLYVTARELAYENRRLLQAGLTLLALAIVMELFQKVWLDARDPGSWLWELDTGLEEAAELAGWGLIAAALTSTVCSVLLRLGASSFDGDAAAREAANREDSVTAELR